MQFPVYKIKMLLVQDLKNSKLYGCVFTIGLIMCVVNQEMLFDTNHRETTDLS